MFTKTSDCLEIGNIRRMSDEYRTIPAVQFPCVTEQGECSIMILAMKFNSPVARLSLEAMYLASIGKLSEQELFTLCVEELPSIALNDSEVVRVLKTLRELRVSDYEGETSLKVSSNTLSGIFNVFEQEGCLSFCCGQNIANGRIVSSFDIIDETYLATIYGEDLEKHLSEISTNKEYIGRLSRYHYPEDVFTGRGYLYLSYIDSLSGGAYSSYETLKYAYRTNEHFRDNPDFFNKTHCQCGGELVVRKKNGDYTLMSCINPFCFEKMAFCLADFSRALGVDGLGATTLMDMTRGIALTNLENTGSIEVNYRMLLNDKSTLYLGDSNSLLWGDFLSAIENYKGTVKDLVEAMSLPYIASDAGKILTADIISNKDLTADDLMKASNKAGKHDIKFILNMWFNLEDIRFVILELAKNINLNVVKELLIYITGSVKLRLDNNLVVSYTKKQFENLINETLEKQGENTARIKVNGSLTHKCHALIADQSRDTGSCRRAEGYGIPILTSREFLQQLGGGTLGQRV